MNVPDDHLRREIALFRYRIIADLLLLPSGSAGIGAMMQAKAEQEHTIPGTQRTRVAAETIRDWLHHYRQGGFDALYPKPRADRGQSRRLSPDVAELLVTIKAEHSTWSVRQVIQSAHDSGQLPDALRLPPSTVHRLLSREGLMIKRSDQPLGVDRRRFTFKYAGEMWMSDVMHGPKVGAGRQRHRTCLSLHRRRHPRHPLRCLCPRGEHRRLPAGVQAGTDRRGLPHRLFVDNGANYRSQHLALVCAKLGIALIHARPYQPAGKGKIERWFRTVRSQFLTTLQTADTANLEALNRRLWAYVEGEYHHAPHRGLADGKTPLDQWGLAGGEVRYVDAAVDLDDLLFEAKRRVMKDRTVSLDGRLYEVDALLVPHRDPALRSERTADATAPGRPRRSRCRPRHHPRRLRQHRRQTRPALAPHRTRSPRTRAAAFAPRATRSDRQHVHQQEDN